MNEALFSAASLVAIGAWCVLVIAAFRPACKARARLLYLGGRIAPLGLCALYAAVIVLRAPSPPGSGFSSLAAFMTGQTAPGNALTGWLHFLAFDLWVGRWVVDDTLRGRAPRLALVLSLPATLMYGPLGLLLHLTLGRLLASALPKNQGPPVGSP